MKKIILFLNLAILANQFAFSQAQEGFNLIASNTEEWDGTIWIEVDSSTFEFNSDNKQTHYAAYDWNSVDMKWDMNSRRLSSYDANGNNIQNIFQQWDGLLYVNAAKSDYTFDANANITSLIEYNRDGAVWLPTNRYTTTFDAQDNATMRISERYVSGSWLNINRTVYTFVGNQLSTTEIQSWVAGNWEKDRRTVYTTNSIGKDSVRLGQKWNGSTFDNDYRYFLGYDTAGNLTLETYIDWVAGVWQNISRKSKTYNTARNIMLDLSQDWNGSSWVNSRRYVYTYTNKPTLNDSAISQNWVSGAWQNNSLSVAQYDADDNLVTSQSYQWTGSAWENYYRYFDYYEKQLTIGINELINTVDVKAYPVPFNDNLNFELPAGAQGAVKIQLFDMAGKLVYTVTQGIVSAGQPISISTENIPNGPYVFELIVDGKKSSGLISK